MPKRLRLLVTPHARLPRLEVLEGSPLLVSSIAHQFVRSALPWFVFPEGVARYETTPDDPAELVGLWREARQQKPMDGET